MSLLLEIYGYRIVSFTLTGGTAQQRAWATGVLQGAFNYQTEPNPNPPPAVRRKAVNGSDTWLDDLSRVFPLQHVPLALPTQAVMRNQATEPNSGQVYDFDQIVTYPTGPKVTIKWVPEPAAPGHSEFAATFFTAGVPGVSGPNWEIQVRDTMGTDAMDPQWQGQDFYQETLAHELGHVLTRVVMLRLGEEEAIAAFRELFDAPTAPWNTGPWEGRLEEAVAEFFKDMIWPTRRYDSRTNLKLPRAHFEAWKDVMVDLAVTAPEEVIQYETRSAWQYAFVGGSIHQHDGGLQPPSTFGAIPGDWYTYYAYNLNGDFSYDDHAGGFLIPVYGVATDSGKRSTATNFYVDWSTRSPGNAQTRATALPRDPLEITVTQRSALGGANQQQGLDYGDFTDIDIGVYAEWYVFDSAGPAPTDVGQAHTRVLLGRIADANDHVFQANPPAVTLAPGQVLRLTVFMEGIFPVFTMAGNLTGLPQQMNAWVKVPWRYEDDIVEQEPWWVDPRWPYFGLIPSEVTAYPADPGWRRRLERIY